MENDKMNYRKSRSRNTGVEEMTDETYDPTDPATWPDDSYAGHERDLAYALNEDTMSWFHTATEYADDDNAPTISFSLFLLMIMHPAAAEAMIDRDVLRRNDLHTLIAQVQDDARDDSGEPFHTAMMTRLAAWTTLQDLAARYRNSYGD